MWVCCRSCVFLAPCSKIELMWRIFYNRMSGWTSGKLETPWFKTLSTLFSMIYPEFSESWRSACKHATASWDVSQFLIYLLSLYLHPVTAIFKDLFSPCLDEVFGLSGVMFTALSFNTLCSHSACGNHCRWRGGDDDAAPVCRRRPMSRGWGGGGFRDAMMGVTSHSDFLSHQLSKDRWC